jgi:sugar lactone lactonase YvrE
VDNKIYVTCRDQLARLHDFNGDEEIDFVESFNHDHQVTEHFHEFAMGLQTDDQGNFYYAKSARHAKVAVVPQHGTLLKVAADGSSTEIIATGFRAANGVCMNPDGTWIVTSNLGEQQPLDHSHPLQISDSSAAPVMLWRRNLPARIHQNLMYQWQTWALDKQGPDAVGRLWLESAAERFLLARV